MNDPRRLLESLEHAETALVRDSGVDAGGSDRAVPEVILDELERAPSVQEMGRDRVAEPVARERRAKLGEIAIMSEAGLDLPLPERARPARKERAVRRELGVREVAAQESRHCGEGGPLGPDPALTAADHDAGPLEIDVAGAKERLASRYGVGRWPEQLGVMLWFATTWQERHFQRDCALL